MKGQIKKFFLDESGQTSTEYILLLVVVAFIIFKMKDKLSEKLTGLVDSVFEKTDGILNDL